MLNDIRDNLIEQFNKEGNILFRISPYMQQFYDNDILDIDGMHYVAGVITEVEMPRIENFYQTKNREFEILVKGVQSDLAEVQRIVSASSQFKVGSDTYYLGDLIVNDIKNQENKDSRIKVFYGTLRLGVQSPKYVTGNDVTYKIDDVDVQVVQGVDVFDKALISTVEFGDNYSDINTGQEQSFNFVVGNNQKVDEIFLNIINNTFNKSFVFEIDYKVAVMTVELVLRRGTVMRYSDNRPLMFTAVFTRALERQTIKINNQPIVAINFNPQLSIIPLVTNQGGKTKQRAVNTSNTYGFYLENDKSPLITEMIKEFKNHTNKKFTLEFSINGINFQEECIITNLVFTSSENTNAVLNVTMGEGVFF